MTGRTRPALSAIHTIAFDFDGIFTDNKVWVDERGIESVRCDRADGFALDLLRRFQRRGTIRADVFIVSKERNPVVQARAKKLQLTCHAGVGDKLTFMQSNLAQRFPLQENVMAGLIYLGNDLNDLPLMRKAGYAVAPCDAHSAVQEAADRVLSCRGGEGFVRAFIEELFELSSLSPEKLDELVSDC